MELNTRFYFIAYRSLFDLIVNNLRASFWRYEFKNNLVMCPLENTKPKRIDKKKNRFDAEIVQNVGNRFTNVFCTG